VRGLKRKTLLPSERQKESNLEAVKQARILKVIRWILITRRMKFESEKMGINALGV
jgi:hypothetical protein